MLDFNVFEPDETHEHLYSVMYFQSEEVVALDPRDYTMTLRTWKSLSSKITRKSMNAADIEEGSEESSLHCNKTKGFVQLLQLRVNKLLI